jgi:hypothetical protein
MHTGFMSKSHRVQSFSQLVTVQNTKPFPLAKLKIIDQIPISQEHDIVVKVLSPALNTIAASGHTKGHPDGASMASTSPQDNGTRLSRVNSVDLGDGVVAQWEGLQDDIVGEDISSIADGKFAWVCSNVASQGTVRLLLQYEVSAPKSTDVYWLEEKVRCIRS